MMATEYKLSYTAKEIDERLGRIDSFESMVNNAVGDMSTTKVSLPTKSSFPDYGDIGQFAVSDGNGGITWQTIILGEEVEY